MAAFLAISIAKTAAQGRADGTIWMGIQLNDIALFVPVADAGNFSKAFEQYDIPSSTLSRRVAHLEKQLGERLFRRSTRHLELTDFGRAFLDFFVPQFEKYSAVTSFRGNPPAKSMMWIQMVSAAVRPALRPGF